MRRRSVSKPSPDAAGKGREGEGEGRRTSGGLTGSRRTRAFVLATAAFVVVLIAVYSLRLGTMDVVVAPVTQEDLALLEDATRRVQAATTVSGFTELVEAAAHIGCSAELMLEQLVAAEEADDDDGTLANVPLGSSPGAGVGRAALSSRRWRRREALKQYEEQLEGITAALAAAADVSYSRLKQMLRREPGRVLPHALDDLPRTVFGALASTVHLYSVVLAEYHLMKDDSERHARALLRSVDLLSWSAGYPRLFNWTGAPCRKSIVGVTKEWLRFCETSLSSSEATATRRAASFEELIALYPRLAPFRLHHAVLLILRESALATSTSALRLIRSQEEKLASTPAHYQQVDPLHGPVLVLLEAFATPVEQLSLVKREEVRRVLTTTMRSCEAFLGDPGQPVRWPTPFDEEARPALFSKKQVQTLLAKLRLLLGPDFPENPLEGNCLAEP